MKATFIFKAPVVFFIIINLFLKSWVAADTWPLALLPNVLCFLQHKTRLVSSAPVSPVCNVFSLCSLVTLMVPTHRLLSWTGRRKNPRTPQTAEPGCCCRNDSRKPKCPLGSWRPPPSGRNDMIIKTASLNLELIELQVSSELLSYLVSYREYSSRIKPNCCLNAVCSKFRMYLCFLLAERGRHDVWMKVSSQKPRRRSFNHGLRKQVENKCN